MGASAARGPHRLVRLALATGAVAIGTVTLSLLTGSPAHASSHDDRGGLTGLVADVGDLVGTVVEPVSDVVQPVGAAVGAVTVPIEAIVDEVEPVTAAVAPMAEAATAPVAQLVETVAVPIAPVTEAVVTPVADTLAPVTGALAPVTAPVASIADPVVDIVDETLVPGIDDVLGGRVVAPVVTPVTEIVEETVGAITQPTPRDPTGSGVVPPSMPAVPTHPMVPAPPIDEIAGPQPSESGTPAPIAPIADDDASVKHDAPAVVVSSTLHALVASAVGFGQAVVADTAVPQASETRATDRAVPIDAPAVPSPATVPAAPAGAGSAGGAAASSVADIHGHLLPELSGGQAGAIDHDRAPASIVEEHTTSPD